MSIDEFEAALDRGEFTEEPQGDRTRDHAPQPVTSQHDEPERSVGSPKWTSIRRVTTARVVSWRT
ncbi:MAG: hypothetical protein KY460_10480 [Actinobacteria bacterium]|nr:hypothetical protein [Actinomycetota bacterium]